MTCQLKWMALIASFCLATTAYSQSTTQPAPTLPPPTPEQQKIIDEVRNHDPAKPQQKMDTNRVVPRLHTPNDNFGQVDRKWIGQHEEILRQKAGRTIDVVFLGDSITARWNAELWQERYAKLNAANFGIGGDRTQHVLWRITEGGELDGLHPKLVVLLIGTNNGFYNKPPEIAAGINAIVETIRTKLPSTKVLLLGVLPRSPSILDKRGRPDSQRLMARQVNDLIAKFDDGKSVRYLEVWDAYLDKDGNIPLDLMPDSLHLSPAGYRILADAMQPLIEEMMR